MQLAGDGHGALSLSCQALSGYDSVEVTVKSANDFLLKNQNHEVAYTLATSTDEIVGSGDKVAAFNGANQQAELTLTVTDEDVQPGQYADILTFTTKANPITGG